MIKIKKMTAENIDDVLKISVEQFGKHSWAKISFLAELENERKHAFVLMKNNEILGFIIFMLTEGEAGQEFNITNLAIQQNFKKMGHATALINFVKEFSQQQQIKKIWLEVCESNLPAINLYKKNGFQTDYIRKSYYPNGKSAYIMSFKVY